MRFSCFPEEKTLTPVQCCVRWPECKGVCLAFRSRKNYTVAKNRSGLLFPFFPSSPRVFCARIYFLRAKIVLFFFACCFLLAFGLCLFVRFGPFPAAIMLLCLRLLLASIIPWSSPSPLYFSCPFIFFFAILTCLLVLLF